MLLCPSLRHVCRLSGVPLRQSTCRALSGGRPLRSNDAHNERLSKTRNLGIIAHIDAGKTTTTERMLFYSGFTRRIGDVDDGSTVTDFLPAERARGITIQSAAITFHWPPALSDRSASTLPTHTLNLIDTPGHADFTFEVIRSLRVLDGAVCILDGVAGVEAQTERVWHQSSAQHIPRLIYVNKLDRDGAAFNRTVKEIASRLHTCPVLCHIPWWKDGRFIGIGDAINYRALSWETGGDGSSFEVFSPEALKEIDPAFAAELLKARTALLEGLTEHDEILVEQFLDSNEDWEGFSPQAILESIRRVLLNGGQAVTPVFAGASFRNIGVQPLLDAVDILLPAPTETRDPSVSVGGTMTGLRKLKSGEFAMTAQQTTGQKTPKKPQAAQKVETKNLQGLALAFKVVSDAKRGVLVYVRVYSGVIARNALLYNTTLGTAERAHRLLRMYANEAVEIDSIEDGQIGVIAGLKHARTGDTIMVYQGMTPKAGPPAPLNTLQLQPINVPPPLFFASIEPNSLAEEKHLEEGLALLLREDPSLSVSTDVESGQTHLAGMGELHLEIARDRLLGDFKVKARMGSIEISYREAVAVEAGPCKERFEKEIAGKQVAAGASASVSPLEMSLEDAVEHHSSSTSHTVALPDNNLLVIQHAHISNSSDDSSAVLPQGLSVRTAMQALQSGVTAALARGPSHTFPVHSTRITLDFDAAEQVGPTSTSAALTSAARAAVTSALRASNAAHPVALMEPVMRADIAVTESSLGSVVHDLTAARGAQVLSLDAEPDDEDGAADASGAGTAGRVALEAQRLTPAQLDRVYAPPDPFGGDSGGSMDGSGGEVPRLVRARVPLKEMVGYLKHLRSLTGGRGTFVMSVDRFEKMNAQRVRAALNEMRGDFG